MAEIIHLQKKLSAKEAKLEMLITSNPPEDDEEKIYRERQIDDLKAAIELLDDQLSDALTIDMTL